MKAKIDRPTNGINTVSVFFIGGSSWGQSNPCYNEGAPL